MKKFLLKIIIFALPISIYCFMVIIVDPYNFFGVSKIFSDRQKKTISYKINYPLYKLLEYYDAPCQSVIFGDSRSEKLGSGYFEKLTGLKHFNMAYGGCSIPELASTFWEVAIHNKLLSVYIGVNFDQFNLSQNKNRTIEAISIKNNIVRHIFNRYTIKSVFFMLTDYFTEHSKDLGKPSVDRNDFWEYQLNSTAANLFRVYSYPESYLNDLEQIASYCRQNEIKLVFFSPPTHIDLQENCLKFDLAEQSRKFKKSISSLGAFVDLDVPSTFTKNKENFLDPFHIKKEFAEFIVQKIVLRHK